MSVEICGRRLGGYPVLGKIQVEVGSSINNFYKAGGN
jgi:hypothetical protein